MNRRESLLALVSLAIPIVTLRPKRNSATVNVMAFSGLSDADPGYALQSPRGLIHKGAANLAGVYWCPCPVELYYSHRETVHTLDRRPFPSEVLKLGVKNWNPNV